MIKTELDETYIFKTSIEMRVFCCNYWYKIPFFRVSVTIEPDRSLQQFVTKNCFDFMSITIVWQYKTDTAAEFAIRGIF